MAKKKIAVTVDESLLAEIDKHTSNRSEAVEEGLRLWRKQQIKRELAEFYRTHQQTPEEEEWDEFSSALAFEAWEADGD